MNIAVVCNVVSHDTFSSMASQMIHVALQPSELPDTQNDVECDLMPFTFVSHYCAFGIFNNYIMEEHQPSLSWLSSLCSRDTDE